MQTRNTNDILACGQVVPKLFEPPFASSHIGQAPAPININRGRRFIVRERIPLAELADVDIEKINKDDLVDVRGLTFDITVPMEQRAERVIEMVKNPYCYRVGKLGVKLEFKENAPPLHDMFTEFLIRLKCGL